jgi:hypothetical protein
MSLLAMWEKAVVYVDTIDTAIVKANQEMPEVTFSLGKRRPRPQPAVQLWRSLRDIHALFLAGTQITPDVQLTLRKWVRFHRLGWKVGFKMNEQEALRFLSEIVETSEVAAGTE